MGMLCLATCLLASKAVLTEMWYLGINNQTIVELILLLVISVFSIVIVIKY